MRFHAFVAFASAAALAASGAGGSEASHGEDDGGRFPVVVTRDAGGLPEGCSVEQVADRVWTFFEAFNRGDARAAVRIMDPLAGPANVRPRGWYSVTEGRRRHFVAHRRAPLRRYIARRHRQNERLRLVEIDVGRGRGQSVGVSYRVERSADDLRSRAGIRNPIAIGKAAIDCRRGFGKIYVWSMAHHPRRVLGNSQCPPAPEGSGRVTVACTRPR